MDAKPSYKERLERIKDEDTRSFVLELINTIEELRQVIQIQQIQIQELKDEINHLKREQGKPIIKGSKKKLRI